MHATSVPSNQGHNSVVPSALHPMFHHAANNHILRSTAPSYLPIPPPIITHIYPHPFQYTNPASTTHHQPTAAQIAPRTNVPVITAMQHYCARHIEVLCSRHGKRRVLNAMEWSEQTNGYVCKSWMMCKAKRGQQQDVPPEPQRLALAPDEGMCEAHCKKRKRCYLEVIDGVLQCKPSNACKTKANENSQHGHSSPTVPISPSRDPGYDSVQSNGNDNGGSSPRNQHMPLGNEFQYQPPVSPSNRVDAYQHPDSMLNPGHTS